VVNEVKVKVVKTVKCKDVMYWVGQVFPEGDKPIPPDILTEVRKNTGTVEVLERKVESEIPKKTRKLISRG
jgi:hypothetical protein